jgi:hypothetical protein
MQPFLFTSDVTTLHLYLRANHLRPKIPEDSSAKFIKEISLCTSGASHVRARPRRVLEGRSQWAAPKPRAQTQHQTHRVIITSEHDTLVVHPCNIPDERYYLRVHRRWKRSLNQIRRPLQSFSLSAGRFRAGWARQRDERPMYRTSLSERERHRNLPIEP